MSPKARRPIAIAIVGGALGVAIGLGGYAIATDGNGSGAEAPLSEQEVKEVSGQGGIPVTYAETRSSSGPALDASEAAAKVLARLPGSAGVYDLKVSAAPVSALDPSLPWLDIYLDAASTQQGDDVALTWTASLVQGAMADLMWGKQRATNSVIGGSRVFVRTPSGEIEELDGGGGAVATGQVFAAQSDGRNDDQIAASVGDVIKTFGLQLKSVEVLRPMGPAISVVATLPDDASVDWTIDELRAAITGTPTDYEGVLLTILDPTGSRLLVSGVAYRTGLGGLWFADGQDDRFGAIHGGPPHG